MARLCMGVVADSSRDARRSAAFDRCVQRSGSEGITDAVSESNHIQETPT